jgi:hypothetical protein
MMLKYVFVVLFVLPLIGCLQLLYKLFRENRSNELLHLFYSGLCGGFIYAFIYSRFEYHFLEIYLVLLLAVLIKSIFMKIEGPKVKKYKYFFAGLTLVGTFYVLAKEYQVLPSTGFSIAKPILMEDGDPLLVAKGGNSIVFNHHMTDVRQRWALDISHKMGLSEFLGMLTSKNEDFRVFGKKIVAPCKGKVIHASDEMEDQAPGLMKPEVPEGNSIEIACEDPSGKVYTFRYAHLKQHSKKVVDGDAVERGTVIAEVGNTGNTSWPHLHIDVMDEAGTGVPIFINERFLRAGQIID